MTEDYTSRTRLPDLGLWDRLRASRRAISFDLELTARCNNDCRHCYINLPAADRAAASAELTTGEIVDLASQAAELGAVWCLLTGGEPLLRHDFEDVYLGAKRVGLLTGVFTNACLVTERHVELFRRYPPRDLEVSVYGATAAAYERVTRRPGSYAAFRRGLDLLLDGGVPVRLKAVVLRSNVEELEEMSAFCRQRTRDYYRFDPLLHLRYDGDEARNAEIRAERLSAAEVVAVERSDPQRFGALERGCRDGVLVPALPGGEPDRLFRCGAGTGSFVIGHDGGFRLCGSLWAPGSVACLRPGAAGCVTLREAWEEHVPRVRELAGSDRGFLERCSGCPIVNLCLWCPAHAHLETGRPDAWAAYFCEVAHARAAALGVAAGVPPDHGDDEE